MGRGEVPPSCTAFVGKASFCAAGLAAVGLAFIPKACAARAGVGVGAHGGRFLFTPLFLSHSALAESNALRSSPFTGSGPFPSAMGEMRVQTSCAVLPRRWRALASAPTFASAGSTAPSDSMSSATDMRRCTWSTCSVTRPSVSPKRSARLAASCHTWDLSQDARGLPHNFASRWVPIFCRTTEGPILLSSLVLALLFFFSFWVAVRQNL